MPTDEPSSFDLAAFMEDDVPDLLAAEADDDWDWGNRSGQARRPVTALTAPDGPIATLLSAPPEPPEDASRADRAAFYADREAARVAAVQAAQDAAEDHRQWRGAQEAARWADRLDASMARSVKAIEEGKAQAPEPPRGPSQPADYGRW